MWRLASAQDWPEAVSGGNGTPARRNQPLRGLTFYSLRAMRETDFQSMDGKAGSNERGEL
jgi:hypothetical protein